jgi:hypothetical protein
MFIWNVKYGGPFSNERLLMRWAGEIDTYTDYDEKIQMLYGSL